MTRVYRTRVIEGVSVPAVIHNDSYFFVDLTVYEDGTIECWELTDLELFGNKLKKGWVKTSIPDGKSISVHGLGEWEISKGEWLFNEKTFFEYVFSLVKKLNPQMQNLYKIYEKKINGVRIMESGRGTVFREHRRHELDPFPKKINGDGFDLFFREADKYFLVRLIAFADGKIRIERLPEPIEFDMRELTAQIRAGRILTEIPENSPVEIYGLGSFRCGAPAYPATTVDDKLLEARDIVEQQNDRPSSIEICRSAWKDYLENPTVESREKLKTAYENIPEHQRRYIGDMDIKDTAVRMIIYGDDEIKNWSHYKVAEMLGDELPTIKVPKPEEE